MKTLTAVILLASIGSILSIKCYVCTYGVAGSTNTDACLDPFTGNGTSENLLYIDCESVDPAYDVCAKSSGTLNGVFTVARTCFPGSGCLEENGCVSRDGATACCCGTDGCNGAGSLAVSIAATVTLFFSTVMFTL